MRIAALSRLGFTPALAAPASCPQSQKLGQAPAYKVLLLLASVFFCGVAHAQAQTEAEKLLAASPFTLVSPFPPGGPVDMLARMLADGLQAKYKQTAIVENITGAAGNLGMDKVKKAAGKAHTLLVIPAGNLSINPTLMPNFPFDIARDFTPVSMLAKTPNVLVANPALGVKNLKTLVELAKAKPSTLAFASPGVGSGLHLAGELFKDQAKIDLTHVPYRGSPQAMNDVLGGSVPLMFSNLPVALPHLKSGKLVALGVTDSQRASAAPEIPTFAEQGVEGVVVTSWYALMLPSGVSDAVAQQLAQDAKSILQSADAQTKLSTQGLTMIANTPQEFKAHLARETTSWAKIIREKNIKAE